MATSWVTAGFSIHPFYTILDICTKFANLPSMLLKAVAVGSLCPLLYIFVWYFAF
jgi:hypothetical protein